MAKEFAENQGSVVAAEGKGIGEHDFYGGIPCTFGDIIEVAVGVGGSAVDRRWNKAMMTEPAG